VNAIVGVPAGAIERLAEPAAPVRKTALTAERPPGEPAAEAGQERPGQRPTAQRLHRQYAAADTDEPAGEGELLARAVPAAALPDAFGRTMIRQIQSGDFSHAADVMQVWGQVEELAI